MLIEYRKPADYITEDILISGDPHKKVDVVYIAEGYTGSEKEKFFNDVRRYCNVFVYH